MPALRRLLFPFLLFLVVSAPLCWAWSRVDDAYARALAPTLARVVGRWSRDVVFVDHDERGDPILVLKNDRRRPVVHAVAAVAGFTVPVFVSLLAAACSEPALRRRLASRRGLGVALAGGIGLVAVHGLAFVTLFTYALSADNRGTVSRALRLAGTFTDILLPYVPFLLVGLVLLLSRPSAPAPDPS